MLFRSEDIELGGGYRQYARLEKASASVLHRVFLHTVSTTRNLAWPLRRRYTIRASAARAGSRGIRSSPSVPDWSGNVKKNVLPAPRRLVTPI